MSRLRQILAVPTIALCLLQWPIGVGAAEKPSSASKADAALDTVVVTGTREAMRRQIQSFVSSVTRMDGELIGRWRDHICPMVVGLSNEQAQFVQGRLIEVQNNVRKLKPEGDKACDPNLFVIVTDEAEQVLASWKARDPGMFRWKERENVSRSNGTGPVRTWHNAIMQAADGSSTTGGMAVASVGAPLGGVEVAGGGPDLCGGGDGPPCLKARASRLEKSAVENINAVVVLVDTRAAGAVKLSQLADYIAMVSLSQLDLTAKIGDVNSILKLFAEPRPETPPMALTEWDFAFLHGLYRVNYSPMNQRQDLTGRMTRALAPR